MTAAATPRPAPAWWLDAARLAADGLTQQEIGERLGRGRGSVERALAGMREEVRSGAREAGDIIIGKSPGAFIAAHTPRRIAKGAGREASLAAARDFAAGRISRAEMMRRISPEAGGTRPGDGVADPRLAASRPVLSPFVGGEGKQEARDA